MHNSLLKGEVWALSRQELDRMSTALAAGFSGIEQRAKPAPVKGVAVLSLFGHLSQRSNFLTRLFGGTSTEQFTRDLRAAVADPQVGAVVIDVDSHGGGVYGIAELAQEIYNLRAKKPIVAVVNSTALSAAYVISSAATELVVTPSGEVGGIGVYALHSDFSKANEADGIRYTYIKAGRFKTAGNPHEPLNAEARKYLQKNVDSYYALFTEAVARYRRKPITEVQNGFGAGGAVGARDALRMGMVDRVATLDETIARMIASIRSGASKSSRLLDERRRFTYSDAAGQARAARYHDLESNELTEDDEARWRRFQLS
jgi:signal peptide peptidase SppA